MCPYLCSVVINHALALEIPACVSVQQVSLSSGENSCSTGMFCKDKHNSSQDLNPNYANRTTLYEICNVFVAGMLQHNAINIFFTLGQT